MSRAALFGLALAGLLLAPGSARAQPGAPFPGFERTDQDLGTWDIVVHAHDRLGRRFRSEGIEVNTPGCDGACVVTRFEGSLAGTWPSDLGLGLDGERSSAVGTVFTATGPKAVLVDPWDTRLDVRYPSSDRRVVTTYGRTASGAEAELIRVTAIRRKAAGQP